VNETYIYLPFIDANLTQNVFEVIEDEALDFVDSSFRVYALAFYYNLTPVA